MCTENANVIYQKEVNTVDFFNYCYFFYYYYYVVDVIVVVVVVFLLLKALQSWEEKEGSVCACVLWVREVSSG